jgi:hypothetical protein
LPDIWAALLWQPSCILCFFGAPDAFEDFGACANADTGETKIAKARAILKIDFMTYPKIVSN